MEEIIKRLEEYLKMIVEMEDLDLDEIGAIADAVKDLAKAKHYLKA
jgi:hypothetical protein